ncbi:uncharacterized protein LOC129773786 [Toxorhynchites rutilus septentrionalis]|uniref:uncharacterized protein LOC129773786 n=1 Tax=Toxorhynchites rutilus septentrionalis TaxID=329112 RepID=UPI00247A474D|nr:uncharacterized protein LOC129773786 [Toxorhynchites rutilus septentrionalis]
MVTEDYHPVIYLNCGGLSTNFVEVRLLVETLKPKLVMINETHVTETIGDDHFQINGYKIISCYSDSRHTGGVMMYVHSSLRHRLIFREQADKNWIVAIEILNGMKPGHYGVLYHSPGASDSIFLRILEDSWLEEIVDLSKFTLLAGDFNINWFNSRDASQLKLVAEAQGLMQLVQQCTRITRTSQTLIDLIFSNCDINVCVVPDFKISDHETLCVSLDGSLDKVDETNVKIKCWKNYSRTALLNLLREKLSEVVSLNNFHEKASGFIEVMKICVNQLVVVKFVKLKNTNKWYTVELQRMKRKRDATYRKFLQQRSDQAWQTYKVHRNEYACTLKRTRHEYVQQSIEVNKHNTKELWKILKKMIKPKLVHPQAINFNGEEVSDEQVIAEKFNEYFVSSIEDISDSIDEVDEPLELTENFTGSKLSKFQSITLEKLKTVVWSLEEKSGSDEINSRILKDAFEAIEVPLLNIINDSLATGNVPDSWKESVVVPIEKVNGTVKAEEHRPINMLPVYEKVLELIVKEQLLEYIVVNDLLVPEQSGYLSRDPTENDVLSLDSSFNALGPGVLIFATLECKQGAVGIGENHRFRVIIT